MKASPVNVVLAFGFVIVNVSVLVPPTRIGSGAKFFEIEGGDIVDGVFVGVSVGVLVGVSIGVPVGVFVGVLVGVLVEVAVGVVVGVLEGVFVGVFEEVGVGVLIRVLLGVDVSVGVGVLVGVFVGVFVGVLVGVFVGARTIIEALAVFPMPPFVDVTTTLLFCVPVTEPSTFTEKLHEPPAASVAPVRLTVEKPAVAAMVPPPQLPVNPFGVATAKPTGNVSVNATLFNTVPEFGLVMMKLNVVVPFNGMVAAPKDLLIDGGATTVTVFEPVLFVSLYSSTFPPGSTVAVFARSPAAVGVTENIMLNEAPTGIVTAPFATQLKAIPVMEQSIVPVGGVAPFVMINAPWG